MSSQRPIDVEAQVDEQGEANDRSVHLVALPKVPSNGILKETQTSVTVTQMDPRLRRDSILATGTPTAIGTPTTLSGNIVCEDTGSESERIPQPPAESLRKGWIFLTGCFLVILCTLGVLNAVGLVENHLESHQLSSFQPRDVAWIPAVNICLTLLVPTIAGPLFDSYGHRPLLLVGTGLFGIGFLSMSLVEGVSSCMRPCQKSGFVALLLTWGVMCGVGAGLCVTGVTGAINNRFERRRGAASGSVMMGSAVGGVIWPILLWATLQEWGWGWGNSIRTLGGSAIILIIVGVVLIWCFAPPTQVQPVQVRPSIFSRAQGRKYMQCFQQADFSLLAGGMLVFQFVVMGVLATLPKWARMEGFKTEMMFHVVAVVNTGSAIGRIGIGTLSDRLGRFNCTITLLTLSIAALFGVFYNVGHSNEAMYAFALFWGSTAGAGINTVSVLVGETCPKEDFGTYYGTMSAVLSVAGFLCVPTSAQVLFSEGTKIHVVFFGALCILSALLMFSARVAHLGWKLQLRGPV